VLWDLALADIPAIDRFEGIAEGLYVKAMQPVISEGGPRRALVYLGANEGPGRPRPDYLSDVLAAARVAGLPRDGIEALERLATEAAPKRRP
jgi:hypothetical protein